MAFTSKPDENPEFALLDQNDPVTGEANVAEPPTTKKNYGWAYLEKPGHNWMNWLHRKTSEWITYFNQFFSADNEVWGTFPIGSIAPFVHGYFADGSNGTFTEVSVSLPDWIKLCDGSALNDADSPIFNGAGRYLPNLTDDRFLMGDIAGNMGDIGGDNDSLAHTHGFTDPNVPGHYHGMGTGADLNITASGSHFHTSRKHDNAASGAYLKSAASNDTGGVITDSVTHTHSSEDFAGNIGLVTGGQNGNASFVTTGGSINAVSESRTDKNIPKYLACKYIMRIK